MPWKSRSVMEERIRFVLQANASGTDMSHLCKEFGISRPTGYLWLNRYRTRGSVLGLEDRSRRPKRSPNRTSETYEAKVISLRCRYGWGARKLRELLLREGLDLTVTTINRILKRNGLIHPKDSHRPATKRFERGLPNQLWQMDFKGDYALQQGRCYPLSIIDDHSRFALGLHALTRQDTETVGRCIVSTFESFGVPEAMLMDHGIPWWGNANGHGLTRLTVGLVKQGIRLCFSGIAHPQTQGKVERFHRTLSEAVPHRRCPNTLPDLAEAFDLFRREYNHVRPHEALGMAVPADRYRPSPKAYNPYPPDWEYPVGSIVKRLNTNGCLDYNHSRLFVCEALAGELVRIENIDNNILVSYRHMYVREIDIDSRRSRSVIRPI